LFYPGTIQDGVSQQNKDLTEKTDLPNAAQEPQEEENAENLENGANNNDDLVKDDVKPSQDEHYTRTDIQYELGDIDEEMVRVVYIDPDTGETVEGSLNEVPEGATIIEIDKDCYHDNDSVASARGSQQDKRQKSVTFKKQQNVNGKQTKSLSKQKGHDFGGDGLRHQRGWGPKDRMYVVPSGDSNADLQEELVVRGLPRDYNVSPLTIFALARSRKENAAKQARRAKQAHFSRSDSPMYASDKNYIEQDYDAENDRFNLNVKVPAQDDDTRPPSQSSSIERAKSSKNPEDNVMKWCINALKKSHTQLFIPAKPSRPGTSQGSSIGAAVNKKGDATRVKKVGIKEGKIIMISILMIIMYHQSPLSTSSMTSIIHHYHQLS
jgi:hypothetical protein